MFCLLAAICQLCTTKHFFLQNFRSLLVFFLPLKKIKELNKICMELSILTCTIRHFSILKDLKCHLDCLIKTWTYSLRPLWGPLVLTHGNTFVHILHFFLFCNAHFCSYSKGSLKHQQWILNNVSHRTSKSSTSLYNQNDDLFQIFRL